MPNHYILPDGRTLRDSETFELGATQYPGNWLRLAMPSELDALGIVVHPYDVPLVEQKAAVKAECRARILARYPEWKQTNIIARSVELQDIWRTAGGWTKAEAAEADAIKSIWAWVKSVRSASDALEAMTPIPSDYTDNKYWPA